MISKTEAAALKRAIEAMGARRRWIPHAEMLALARVFSERDITLDFASTQQIGLPVVVLRYDRRPASILSKLSPREREVASLAARGFRNKEIAGKLGISLATVKDHIHHALAKTSLSSRTKLAASIAGTDI